MNSNLDKWDRRFLTEADNISQWSKDLNTKVGCAIVGPDREIRSTGYNGLPRGANDDIPERLVRPEKLFWFEHAERNAVYNAARVGVPLLGSTMYSTLCPCIDCARAAVQSGIKRVVTRKPDLEKFQLWAESFKRTEMLFTECNIEVTYE